MKLPRKEHKNHRDTASEYELRAIQALNSDRIRSYPAIEYQPRATRAPIMDRALSAWSNRYDLCRATVKLARKIHNPINTRVAHSINNALALLSRPTKPKPAALAIAPIARPNSYLSLLITHPQPRTVESAVVTTPAQMPCMEAV